MSRLKTYQVKQMIWQGEGVNLDFKKTITSCEKIAKTMISFANHLGGKLFIGVADDGTITGVKSEDEEKYMIEKAATFFIKPMLEPTFEEIYLEDKMILVVDILKSDLKPHYALGDDKKWSIYVRIKDKSVLASKKVINVLRREHQEEGNIIDYRANENALLTFLTQNSRINLKDSAALLNVSQKLASKILVTLILAGKLRVHTSEKEEFYTAG
jgi:predicted HTH transcriptional regulator